MNPKYPLYIVSKNRADSRYTSKALEEMKVPYHIVIEQSDYKAYSAVIDKKKILILPERYLDEYDVFDKLGRTKSIGPGAARNFVWDHSMGAGHERHWVMDDNILNFPRWNNNQQYHVHTGAIFLAMEGFVDRYENIAMAGPQYEMFKLRKGNGKPILLNTRIYSCNLIMNSIPYRWRGRYNEDTDLSLRMLKDGWCTVLFNAFLQKKVATQKISGGCTEEFYKHEGTLPKSRIQVAMHPDVSKIVWKFNRWHHQVDYRPFRANKLKLKEGVVIPDKPNNYGMKLVHREQAA